MTIEQLILIAHMLATVYMTGLIWFVQVVHYPLFARIGDAGFADYERIHQQRTTWVVALPMLIELITAALLFTIDLSDSQRRLAIVGAVLIAIIWLSTGLLQVPLHRRLAGGFDRALIRRLVLTNWIRTVAWAGRAGIVAALYV